MTGPSFENYSEGGLLWRSVAEPRSGVVRTARDNEVVRHARKPIRFHQRVVDEAGPHSGTVCSTTAALGTEPPGIGGGRLESPPLSDLKEISHGVFGGTVTKRSWFPLAACTLSGGAPWLSQR